MQPQASPRSLEPKHESKWNEQGRWILLVTLLVLLVGLASLIYLGATSASENYGRVHSLASSYYDDSKADAHGRPDLSLLYMIQAARAQDFVFVKSAALLLSYAIILIGSLFVLHGIKAAYELRLKGQGTESALVTSSPGLVLITLGAVLVSVTLFTNSEVDTTFQWGTRPLVNHSESTEIPLNAPEDDNYVTQKP